MAVIFFKPRYALGVTPGRYTSGKLLSRQNNLISTHPMWNYMTGDRSLSSSQLLSAKEKHYRTALHYNGVNWTNAFCGTLSVEQLMPLSVFI